MKLKSLIGVAIICCLWALPALAQYEPDPLDDTPPDSIIFLWSQPNLSEGNTVVAGELYFYNYPQMVSSASFSAKWDNPKLVADSIVWTVVGLGAFDYFRMGWYKGDVDSSNYYQWFQGVFARQWSGLPPRVTPWHLGTYYFHVEDWTETDTVAITLGDFQAYAFNDPDTYVEYAPIWGGDYTIQDVNRPEPVLLEVSPVNLSFDAETGGANPASQNLSVSEMADGAISYTASTDASWITLTNPSGTTPGTVQVGVDITGLAVGAHTDSILVSSPQADNDAWAFVTLNLTQGNQAPVLNSIGDKTFNEGASSSFLIQGSDPDGPVSESWLTYTTLPTGSSVGYNGSGVWEFSWTPGYDQAGTYPVTFTLSDGQLSDQEAITITVNNTNRAPVLGTIGDQTFTEGVASDFMIYGSDPDGAVGQSWLTYTTLPTGSAVTYSGNGVWEFSWTPDFDQAGDYPVTFTLSDGDLSDQEEITITVSASNQPPVLQPIGNQTFTEGTAGSFTITGSDADGGMMASWLTYTSLPSGSQVLYEGSGVWRFSWTPDYDQAGSYPVTFTLSDGSLTDQEAITITVNNTNRLPVLGAIGNQTFTEGIAGNFTITGSDPDGPVLESWLTYTTLPTGSVITYDGDGVWRFLWTPGYDQAGDYPVTFTLQDGYGYDDEQITITVNNVNRRPVLAAIGDRTVSEGALLEFGVTATDADGGQLTLTADPWPGTEFFTDNGNNTGSFSWTPGNTDAGIYNVWFVASDGELADSEQVTIEVLESDGFVLSPGLLEFTANYGDANPSPQSFNVSVSDGSEIDYTVNYGTPAASWFTFAPAGGTTPSSSEVSVDISGLPGGVYLDSAVIAEVETPFKSEEAIDPAWEFVRLTINYNPVVTPDTLFFEVFEGATTSPEAQAISFSEAGGAELGYVASAATESWVVFENEMTGTTPGNVMVTVSSDGLEPDTYYATIPTEIADAEYTKNVTVKLTVSACPYFDPAQVEMFTTILAGETAVQQTSINLQSVGGSEIEWTTSGSDAFSFSPSSGTTPTQVGIDYSRIFEAEGLYADTAYIESVGNGESVCSATIPVIVNVTVNRQPSADTVIVVSTPAVPGMKVGVPIIFTNSCALSELGLSLSWTEWLNLDSISFEGSALAYINNKTAVFDNDLYTLSIVAEVGEQQLLPIGSEQLMATLWFALPCEIEAGSYPFSLGEELSMGSVYFLRDCGSGEIEAEYPEYLPGSLVVGTSSNYACGYVVDTNDDEIEGATVQLFEDYPTTGALMTTMSSSIGSWAFDDIMTIPFDVYAYKEGYYPGTVEDINFGERGIKIVLQPITESPTITSEWVDYYCPYFPESPNLFLGAPIPEGAVVEAFTDEGLMVGQKMITVAGQYGFMPVYRANSDAGDPGAVTGDMIHFMINGMDAVADGNTMYPSEYMQMEVCLEVRGTVTHECTLFEGWNLVSWNVNTDSDNILTVLDPIMDYVDVVLGFERGGLTFDPNLQLFSTLWQVDHYSGYWIRIEGIDEVTLDVTGLPVDAAMTSIQLYPGWNLVSYLPDETMETEQALAYAGDIFDFAYGFPNGSIEVWQPGGQFNQLLNFDPCNGYWLKCNDYGVLRYTGGLITATPADERVAVNTAALGVTDPFATNNWINLYAENLQLDGRTVPSGTTVKAFAVDGDRQVGTFTMKADGRFGFMPVYADVDNDNGLDIGGEFYLTVNDVPTKETFTWTSNGDRLEVAQLTATSSEELLPQAYSLDQNYPNPFNPSTNISFEVPQASRVKIEIFNVLGRSVAVIFDGQAEAGLNTVVWDGTDASGSRTASGVYFYRMTADNYTETRKMMLLK